MLMQEGRFRDTQLLGPASVAELQRPQVSIYSASDQAYGLGLLLDIRKGVQRVGHEGDVSTYQCWFRLIPAAGVATIIALNARPQVAITIGRHIQDELLGLPAEAPPLKLVDPERTLWARYVGTYLGLRSGLATLQIVNDELVLDWHEEPTTLRALGPRCYTGDRPSGRGTVSVGLVPGDEQPAQFVVVNDDPCRRVELGAQRAPEPGSLDAYAGTYDQDGLSSLTVRAESERLLIGWGSTATDPLFPLGGHRFAFRGGIIEFHVDSEGYVSGITKSEGSLFARVPP